MASGPSTATASASARATGEFAKRSITIAATPCGATRQGGRRVAAAAKSAALRLAQQLRGEERVPAGGFCARGDEPGVRLLAEDGLREVGEGVAAQLLRPQNARARIGGQARQQRLAGRGDGPGRDHDDRLQVANPRSEEREEVERRLVHPLRVVDEHGHRPLGGEVVEQPVQPVKPRERILLRRL